MSLITRGLGENAKMVTTGFGPPPPAEEVVVKPEVVLDPPRGRRRDKPLYEELAKSLWVETYKIQAKLHTINGKKAFDSRPTDTILENDTRESFSGKPTEKVRIKKTISKENIFIKVLKLYKRQ